MSFRIVTATLCVLLAACGGPPDTVAPGNMSNGVELGSGTPAEEVAERIECALGNAAWERACSIERTADSQGVLVTVRHPDGGFRRFRLAEDGTVRVADGAVAAAVAMRDGIAEVAVGDARYRLPAARP